MSSGFQVDEGLQQVAEAYALDAVDIAAQKFEIQLDWTIDSLRNVESILARLHDAVKLERPTDEELEFFAKTMGSYLGEVIRRNHNGEWGYLESQGECYPGLSLGIWPWSRVYRRIIDGPENNVWHFYQALFVADQ